MTVHPLRPPFDTHNLGAEADRLRQVVLTEVGWPLQYDAQVQTLRWIQDNHKLVPRGALQALQDAIGKRLGWPQARVAKCLRLETPAALHRAVRAKPRDTVRLAGEEVYPHEGWLGEYLL